MDEANDKQWAKRYVLDPLTAPEPSQETGPGSSFISPIRRSLSQQQTQSNYANRRGSRSERSAYPSPPSPGSPRRSTFNPSNPFADPSPASTLSHNKSPNRAPDRSGQRSNSVNTHPSRLSPPRYPPNSSALRKPVHGYQPLSQDRPRSASGQDRPEPRPRSRSRSRTRPPPVNIHRRTNSIASNASAEFSPASGLRRSGSLSQRFPGDMSHRPLDMIKREVRAADRAPHIRRGRPRTDTIDSLDSSAIGGAYHHGGPYDATLASRNANPMYSPVAAVHESNMEAIKATPKEYIADSLEKHVPLQGTATIPSGGQDMSGNIIEYQEGADLMREPDAPGGPYKRWEGIQYLDEDLKGKGEPSYTFERDKKARKAGKMPAAGDREAGFEMQSGVNRSVTASGRDYPGSGVPQRSSSNAVDRRRPRPRGPIQSNSYPPPSVADDDNAGRRVSGNDGMPSRTPSTRLSDGIKRRFGSILRKKTVEAAS